MRTMHVLETERLMIRPIELGDLEAAHGIMDRCFGDGSHANDPVAIEARRPWVQWMALNHVQLAQLFQPPYGDRAVVLRSSGRMIGMAGLVPCLAPYGIVPELRLGMSPVSKSQPEVGLFWAINADHQRNGFATEAGRALMDFALDEHGLGLHRIIATTDYDNLASQAVMRALGMTLARNPQSTPAWLQVVGIMKAG